MKHTLLILLLLISVINISYGQGSGIVNKKFNITGPGREIDGCNNPKFKAAELTAYQALLRARTEAAKVLETEITSIEQAKKDQLAKENLKYLADLKTCGNDPQCPGNKKIAYDDGVFIIQAFANGELSKAQKKESVTKETAQKNYDEEVKKAIKLYCPRYKAIGETANVIYSGEICSLERPFTITGTIPGAGIVYPFKFIPASDTAGTFSFYTKWKIAVLEGSGTYTIIGTGTDNPRILVKASSSGTIPTGTTSGGGPAQIDLVRIEKAECDGQ
jgi:hypothetical protein